MNILVFTGSDSSYNSLRPEAEMFINFHKRGHNVTIVTDVDTDYGRIYREHGIHIVNFHTRKKFHLEAIRVIRNELNRKPYDILYATNSKLIPNGAFASIGNRVKVVSYRGTTGGLYRHDPSAYLTHLHPRIDGIVCVSEAVRDDVRKRVWSGRDKVVAIHKGHSLDWYDKEPADLSEFGISEDDFTLICAVNARPSKGIPVMIEACNQLTDLDNLHLLLAGRNMDRYADLIEQNGMRDRIHVLGYRHDVPELIRASDVLVQPSISGEGLPRAVMESMGYGTPTIITTTGGGKEVVEDGETGYVVPTNDAGAIAQKVRILHAEPERVRSMGEKCREVIGGKFSCDRATSLYLEYFQSLLAG